MKRVYHQGDYKSMAVDLLCIVSQTKVIGSIFLFGDSTDVQALVRAAAILAHIGNTIDPEPLIVEDSHIKEVVYSKS